MALMSGHVAETFRFQANACRSLGSPFTAQLCELLADNLDDSSRFGARIVGWPATAKADALALRAAGALHSLARSGRARDLATLYPPAEAKPEALWEVIAAAITRHDDALHDFLDSPPQTNEVARSSAILGMMLGVVQKVGMPLAIYEIGASAGLNLAFDRYHYLLGDDIEWGDANAAVHIDSEWRGNPPSLETTLEIASRKGCDRNPLDPADPAAAERQLAYIWADQFERLARVSAAMSAVAALGQKVEKADAADWVDAQLADPPQEGVARVFYHTIVWQYLPERTKDRLREAFASAGAMATEATPLVWLQMESENHPGGAVLKRTIWPGGETETLGIANYHGRWVDWA